MRAIPIDPFDPALPAGREVALAGRGHTFVRELDGPPGAPTVLLLHGWTATADLNWFTSFAPLADEFRVVALDHRGHGRGLRSDEPFRLADCADDAAALIAALGLGPVIPVGYSMGGPIAQLLWQRHPDLVRGMVLCATSCVFTGTTRERALFTAAAGTALVAGPVSWATRTALHAWNGWRRSRGEEWWGFEQVARHDWADIIEAGRELGRFDSRPWIGDIDVPTAVLATDADVVVPTVRQLDMAARLRQPAVRMLAGGHAVCTTDPGRFVPALLACCRAAADGRIHVAA